MMTGFGMGFGFVGVLLMLLFWSGLIALAVLAVRVLFNSGADNSNSSSTSSTTARDILDQRYARGEITSQEYERMKNDLAGS